MNLPSYVTGTIQTRAYAVLRDNVYSVLSKYNVTPTQWFMLGIISEAKDGIRQIDVAKQMNVKPPLITVMVKELNNQNLVTTVQSHFDSRTKLIGITIEAKKLMKIIENDLNSHLSILLSGLTENDLKVYYKVLNTIINNDSTISD